MPHPGRGHGFTMVELIVVILLVGILGAIGASRFFSRGAFDAAGAAEQGRAMLRYAQKLAVARGGKVYVQGSDKGLALCFDASPSCPEDRQVPVPAGENSGSAATRAFCGSSASARRWYCEGWPDGVVMSPSGTLAPFFFDGLGRPGVDKGSFDGLKLTISAEGLDTPITVSQETGYVE